MLVFGGLCSPNAGPLACVISAFWTEPSCSLCCLLGDIIFPFPFPLLSYHRPLHSYQRLNQWDHHTVDLESAELQAKQTSFI